MLSRVWNLPTAAALVASAVAVVAAVGLLRVGRLLASEEVLDLRCEFGVHQWHTAMNSGATRCLRCGVWV